MFQKKLKIAFVTFEFPPDNAKGGIGTYTYNVANLLTMNGAVVHVFAASFEREVSEIVNGVNIHWIKTTDSFQFRKAVVELFSKIHSQVNFDLLESAEINGNGWDVKKRFPDLPLVVRLHAPNYLVEHTKQFYISRVRKIRYILGSLKIGRFDLGYWKPYNKDSDPDYQFTLLADYITAPSQWMANWACDNWKLSKEDLTVFPNPFLLNPFLLEIPIVEKHPHKSIVFYGRLNVLKGLVNLTYSMKVILKKYPNWRWRIIGDDGPGPLGDGTSMKTWISNQLGSLLSRIEFIDGCSYDQLSKHLEKAEIMIIPSLFESYSYVCKEGMTAGKAIIGSNVGGISTLIKDGYSGFLINPYNVDGIIKNIENLIDNSELCYFFSKNARNQILNDNTSVEILKFYNGFVKRKD